MKTMTHFFITILLVAASCTKSIQVEPPIDQLNSNVVFTDDKTATAALNGIYSSMMQSQEQIFNSGLTLYTGLAADELFYFTPSALDEFQQNQITPVSHATIDRNIWSAAYKYIYAANACIEGLTKSTSLTPSTRTVLLGEAKFVRAFCFFHLVQLFGDVPLTLSTDLSSTVAMSRTEKETVWQQIITDLSEAENLLPSTYIGTERIRPVKWAASALLARVYLYRGDWGKAEITATSVISSPLYQLLTNLNEVFLGTSKEAIWQLKPVNLSRNTHEARLILPASASAQPTYLITPSLVSRFETADKRKVAWIKSHNFGGQSYSYPFKYKVRGAAGVPITEYYTALRLAEMYLVRGEALVRQDKLIVGQADLNTIRSRAGISTLNLSTKQDLLDAIEDERRRELFAELGHRWFDLIRTNRANSVLSLKGPTWQPTDQLWPLPQAQLNLNGSLTQNPGY